MSVLGVILFSLLAAFGVLKYNTDIGGHINTAEYCVLTCIIPICVAVAYSSIQIGCEKNLGGGIGKVSFELYLIHGLFYYMFQMGRLKIENKLVFCICVIAASLVASFILNIINKYLVKLLQNSLDVKRRKNMKKIGIMIPCYNEQEILFKFAMPLLRKLPRSFLSMIMKYLLWITALRIIPVR